MLFDFERWWYSSACVFMPELETDSVLHLETEKFIDGLERAWKAGCGTVNGFPTYLLTLYEKNEKLKKSSNVRITTAAYKNAMKRAFLSGEEKRPVLDGPPDFKHMVRKLSTI